MTLHEQERHELAGRVEALREAVAALEKQVGRAGREQLKANALAETQTERLAAALEALRAGEQRAAAELSSARAEAQRAAIEARLDVARAIFPTVDGLDEAIRAGEATLEQYWQPEPAAALLRRLLRDEPPPAHPELDGVLAALRGWLEGLGLLRRRLLDALAAHGVTPIASVGRAFDPHRHIAVEVHAAAAAPGTVVQELRRGFVAGERVLRHAEVAVAGTAASKDIA